MMRIILILIKYVLKPLKFGFSVFSFGKKHKKQVALTKLQLYMTKQIEKLGEKEASEIMTPRVDIVHFKVGDSLEEVLKTIRKNGFSRYPVWKNNVDDIIGILYLKDLLFYLSNIQSQSQSIKDLILDESLVRKAIFVPKSKQLEGLLSTFQSQKVHIALILDEYGGFSGLVTLEDVIEVITGDIQDEHDHEEEEIHKISDNVYIVDGRTSLELLSEQLGLDYSKYIEDIDSIGGVIYSAFDRIPNLGERIEIDGITYQVQQIVKNKIISVKIWIPLKDNQKDKDS